MTSSTLQTTQEILFIDATLANLDVLLADARPGVAVVLLQPGQDPWQTMTSVIEQYEGLTAIHLVSHGQSGALILDGQRYDANAIRSQQDLLTSWTPHLASGADVLLYGCDVGAGSAGGTLLSTLARLTLTDVAASTDATGSALAGGNWVLETASGLIESGIAFTSAIATDYSQILPTQPQTVVVTTGTNMDPTKATTGLVGAGKLITMNPVTITMGTATNLLVINAYDVDYGMKTVECHPELTP